MGLPSRKLASMLWGLSKGLGRGKRGDKGVVYLFCMVCFLNGVEQELSTCR